MKRRAYGVVHVGELRRRGGVKKSYDFYQKQKEGMPDSMFAVVDDERYWKNMGYLVARYHEFRGDQKKNFTNEEI